VTNRVNFREPLPPANLAGFWRWGRVTIEGMRKGWKLHPLVLLAAVAFVVFPVVYVLSAGPMSWLAYHGYVDEGFANAIYRPLIPVIQSADWLDELWSTYLEFWLPERQIDPETGRVLSP
jgi:hypothetical protein